MKGFLTPSPSIEEAAWVDGVYRLRTAFIIAAAGRSASRRPLSSHSSTRGGLLIPLILLSDPRFRFLSGSSAWTSYTQVD
jgi:hypothetical protein